MFRTQDQQLVESVRVGQHQQSILEVGLDAQLVFQPSHPQQLPTMESAKFLIQFLRLRNRHLIESIRRLLASETETILLALHILLDKKYYSAKSFLPDF